MAIVIDGKNIAATILAQTKSATQSLQASHGIQPGLAVVLVGEDPASQVYVASKSKTAHDCGFRSIQHTLSGSTSQNDLASLVEHLNQDPDIHGILVQLPLPEGLSADPIIQSIKPEKDVDGLNVVNAGKLATGDTATGLVSCTPAGAMLLIQSIHGRDLSGLHAVVLGRSNLFGKPMSALLLAANATVTTAHSRTKDLPAFCRQADLLICAVGRPKMVKSNWIKPGATVIDVGINRVQTQGTGGNKTRLVGDVDFQQSVAVAGAISPVPGGVGPMTIAMLMANVATAAYRQTGLAAPRFSLENETS